MTSARTEQIYVTRGVRSMLETLAQLACAAQPEGTEGPCIGPTADAIADQMLREALDGVPRLAERKRKIRKAIAAIDAEEAQELP